ncbi:MAG: hypothetical protein ACTS78_03045 [Arsenophonus sp. NC-WZS1-MAG3]
MQAYYLDANLPQYFQILGSVDQYRLLLKIIKTINLDENKWSPHQAIWYINAKKMKVCSQNHIKNYDNPKEVIWL